MLPPAIGWGAEVIPLHIKEYTESLDFTIYYGGTGDIRLFDITVKGEDFRPWDVLVTGFLVLFFYILLGYLYFKGEREKFSVFAFLLFLAVISSYPYFSNILFYDTKYNGNDMPFHLLRIAGIRDGILSGQFPVRIYPTAYYGTGYDCSLYYPDIFLYFPAILCLLGVSLAAAVQIFGFFLHFLSAWITYYSARKIGGTKMAGLLSATIYTLCGYFCYNLFFRADLGESIAMCFFPLVICGFYSAVLVEEKDWRPLCIGMSGLLLSHIISALFAVILLAVFSLCFVKKIAERNAFFTLLKSAGASFMLCAWFLIPFFEMYQRREETNIVNMMAGTDKNALELGKIFGGFEGGRSQSLGMSLALGAILCLYFLFRKGLYQKESERRQVLILFFTGLGLAVCTTSIFPWKMFMSSSVFHDITALIQFPWRLLGPASAFLTLAIGLAADKVFHRVPGEVLLSSVFVICLALFAFRIDTYTYQEKDIYLRHGDALRKTDVAEDYLYQFTQTGAFMDLKPDVSDYIDLLEYEKDGSNVTMKVSAEAGTYVGTTLLYFNGYKAFDERGNVLPCERDEKNMARIRFPVAYTGEVYMRYTGNFIWRIFDIVSAVSLLAFVGIWILEKRNVSAEEGGLYET